MTQLRAIKSWYDNRHGVVTVQDDVLSIVRQVRSLFGDRISIQLDDLTGWYHFVEHCEDKTDRLIFSSESLTPLELERLLKADSFGRAHEDPYDALEREQDEMQAKQDAAFREMIREAAERTAHAVKKDGLGPRFPLMVPIEKGLPDARR